MAFDASPPIISKYTRQMNNIESRPRTPVTESLEESSLAAWWNIDKTMNLPNNLTPFRKQRYEPLKWANAHLLLDEDGAEFLADDPFATPAPPKRLSIDTRRPSSSRKRISNAASSHRRASRSSVGSHKELTLADLTPRSRRISGVRAKNGGTQRPRTSEGRADPKPLRLSFNGPPFALSPRQDLEVIQEHQSPAPLLPAFRPVTPERVVEPPSPARNQRVSPKKIATRTPTQPLQLESRPNSTRDGAKQKRKSRGSIPVAPPVQNDSSDDEELHKSIPGAFDFVSSELFKPQLPISVPQKKVPRKSNQPQEVTLSKSTSSTSIAPAPTSIIPTTATNGLASMLAEYGSSLIGVFNPTVDQPTTQQQDQPQPPSRISRKLSDVSTKRPVAKDVPKHTVPTGTQKKGPPSPTRRPESNPSSKLPTRLSSKLQNPSQITRKPSIIQHTATRTEVALAPTTSVALQDVDHPNPQPSRQQEAVVLPVVDEATKRRRHSRSRPSSTIQPKVSDPLREEQSSAIAFHHDHDANFPHINIPTRNLASHSSPAVPSAPLPVEQPRPRSRAAPILPRSPSPQRMQVDIASPIKAPSPVKARPSISAPRSTATNPAIGHVDQTLKPILKKRALEASPGKHRAEERAMKRQKISEIKRDDRVLARPPQTVTSITSMTKAKEASEKATRGEEEVTMRERSRGRKAKMELAPRKQARSRSRVNGEVPAVVPLILPTAEVSPPIRGHMRSHSRGRDATPSRGARSRSRSRVGLRNPSVHDDLRANVEEDVFGTVMENSLEVVAASQTLANEIAPLAILESISPVRTKQQPDLVKPRRDQVRPGNYRQGHTRVLQPSAVHNSPTRAHSPIHTVSSKTTSVAPVSRERRLDQAEYTHTTQTTHRPQYRSERDEGEECRLTIPFSPKAYMRPQQRERGYPEPQLRREREAPKKHALNQRQKQPFRRTNQREMPPVAAALLAKLAGVEAGLNQGSRKAAPTARTTHSFASQPFTFRSELRPMLGKEGAAIADQALKEQFEFRRSLWEQRSLEASQESESFQGGVLRPTSRQEERRFFATEVRAIERETRRDVGKRRDDRFERNHVPMDRGYRAW